MRVESKWYQTNVQAERTTGYPRILVLTSENISSAGSKQIRMHISKRHKLCELSFMYNSHSALWSLAVMLQQRRSDPRKVTRPDGGLPRCTSLTRASCCAYATRNRKVVVVVLTAKDCVQNAVPSTFSVRANRFAEAHFGAAHAAHKVTEARAR